MRLPSALAKTANWLKSNVCPLLDFKPIWQFLQARMEDALCTPNGPCIVNHDGAFAEYLALPMENLHIVPDSRNDEQAVFVEPLAAACEILDQIDVKELHSAAVLGDGKLAQLIALVLKNRRAARRGVGKTREKNSRSLARAGIRDQESLGNASDLKRSKDSFALLVEATGSPTGLAMALQMTEPRGTLVFEIHVSWRGCRRNLADR